MPVSFLLPGEQQKGLEGDGSRTQLSFGGGVAHQGGPCGGERVLEAQALSLGWDILLPEVVAMLLAGGGGWVCPAWPLTPCVAVGEP